MPWHTAKKGPVKQEPVPGPSGGPPTGYVVTWQNENGLTWRRRFPATPEGLVEAQVLEIQRGRIHREALTSGAERVPGPPSLFPEFDSPGEADTG